MDAAELIQEFNYSIFWRSREPRPGLHRSSASGSGFEFRGYAPLGAADDAKEIDLDATLADPFRRPQVRIVRQRSAIAVYCIADLSASSGFETKMRSLAAFAASLAYSAYRTRDTFGFVGCDEDVREDLVFPAARAKSTALELGTRLSELRPTGRNAEGLRLAHEYLRRRRSLVFLASDFLFPAELSSDVLGSLAGHQVVPVVIRDASEFDTSRIPRFGIARLRDLETGVERFIMLTPKKHRKMKDEFERHEAELEAIFEAHQTPPFYLVDAFDAEQMSEHFLQ